jgi:hypothetical protein
MMPTNEEIKDAHEALDMLNRIGSKHNSATDLFVTRARKALPPLPEPERPRITPAEELAREWRVDSRSPETVSGDAIRARDAEIISWIGSRIGSTVHTSSCQDCAQCTMLDLVRELDKP